LRLSAEHAADEALTVHLSGILKSFAALGEAEVKRGKIGKDVSAAEGKKEKAAAAFKILQDEHKKFRTEFEKKQTALSALQKIFTFSFKAANRASGETISIPCGNEAGCCFKSMTVFCKSTLCKKRWRA
jgi:hypothetical protein